MSVGHLLSWIVCGLVVGFIARLLVRGWHGFGLLATLVLGVAGSLVGGFLHWMIWGVRGASYSLNGDSWGGWALAILGAMLVLWAYGRFGERKWWQW